MAYKIKTPHLQLSEDELLEYKEVFMLYDKNDIGFVTYNNLGRIVRALGQNPTESELQDMIVRFDIDGNGKLDFDEFCQTMAAWKQITSSEEELLLAFRVFDKSSNGYITIKELKEVLQNLGEDFTDDYIEEIFEEADQDCDGAIGYDEFLLLMK